ncbi:MAG: tRNA (N6-isopentenyl adenosine(37)-C2)-methylthiotransferase MiaB, partial [Clostridia bacterium]|nr:tRNA (N6-isopentenyl adenosine(37)-C2)-methylthiotransferase MiaB [Clostridia bacterium]
MAVQKFCENTADIKNQEKYTVRVREILKSRGKPQKYYIATFGCQQNEADSERLAGTAKNLGYKKAENMDEADLIIFNTCAVREHAELRALSKTGQLKHLKEKNKNLLIGLWGCMVSQTSRVEDIKHKYPYVDFVAGTNMLHRLPEILCDCLESDRRRYYVDELDYSIVESVPVERENKIKAYVSIMYGCDNFCTYCIVPYVRGRERSRRKEDILAEVRTLVSDGYKEVTLLGQNVNSYGKKGEETSDFATLVEEICKIEGDFTLRFMTSHPKDVSDRLIEVIKNNPKVERHFHLPVQSGSTRILKLMNRKYTREGYLETVRKLREAVPDIVLTTDIIVGFPGETNEDFEETLSLVKMVKYDSVFSFIYSKRPGTPASEMEDETSDEEKTERMSKLLSL